MAAVIASVGCTGLDTMVFAFFPFALLAVAFGDSAGIPLLFQELKVGIIIGKLAVEIVNRKYRKCLGIDCFFPIAIDLAGWHNY
jgi:hypothetical protein